MNWAPAGTDEPRDQQRDLAVPHHWAQIGPENESGPAAWSWTVLDFSKDNDEVAGGYAADEAAARRAVDEWEAAQ